MMNLKQRLTFGVLTLLVPAGAVAYYSPEDVLLNKELFLPPSAREADTRASLQASEAAARREREQEAFFAAQRPIVEENVDPDSFYDDGAYIQDGLHGAAPAAGTDLSAIDLELASTLRLLTRLEQQQRTLQYGTAGLHGGAPLAPLAPTGAGGILAGITMLGAVVWTVKKARNAGKVTHLVP